MGNCKNMAFTMLPSPVTKRRKGLASNWKQRLGFLLAFKRFLSFQ